MARADADRNLLFGIIALQMDFVSRDALVAAMNAWVLRKHDPIGEVLCEQGALEAPDRAAIDALVERHLERHGGDAEKGLASLTSIGSARRVLESIADSDVQQSLATLATLRASGPGHPPGDGPAAVAGATAGGGRFRVVRFHAKGGLGVVSVAIDRELDRRVALKEIQGHFADEPASRARFLMEAEVTGKLEHPGIVPVYGLGHDPTGRPFYAMRFIEGDSLADAIRRFHAGAPTDHGARLLQLQELLRRFLDVCDAVAYAHARGVLHRDLKPGNVMLGPFGETLVVDWGLAKVTGRAELEAGAAEPLRTSSVGGSLDETVAGRVLGTPSYASPEQVAGRLDELGPATDVYGLGATLYHLLTGRPPLEPGPDLFERAAAGAFPRPRQVEPDVPAALEAVCLKAMAHRPGARYESPRALADDVKMWLADEPVAAHREPFLTRARRWTRRHRTLVASGVAALVVALAGTGVVAALQTSNARRLATLNGKLTELNDRLTVANGREREANEALRGSLGRERAARRLAQDRLALAQSRFAVAMGAIRDFHSGVVDDVMLQRPELKALRDRLLHAAIAQYRRLARLLEAGDPNDPSNRDALASAYFHVGGLTAKVGSATEALDAYREALRLREALVRDHPGVAEYRVDLAGVHNNLGALLRALGRGDGALKAYRAELTLYEALARERPGDAGYRNDLACSLDNVGLLLSETGHADEALAFHRRALGLFEALVREHPDVASYRKELGYCHNNLGVLLRATGHPDEALEAHTEALKLREALARDFPKVAQYRADLAKSHNNLGVLHHENGRTAEALRSFVEVGKLRGALVLENPTVTEYRRDLATTHHNIALVRQALGLTEPALRAQREALRIREGLVRDHPDVAFFRQELAESHDQAGSFQAAAGRGEEALRSSREALRLREALARDHPDLIAYRANLAQSHGNVGARLHALGRGDAALASYTEATRRYEELAREDPRVVGFRRDLAALRHDIGRVHAAAGRRDEALASFREAIRLREGLVRDAQAAVGDRVALAETYHNLGQLLERDRTLEARDAFRRAVELSRAALGQSPRTLAYRRELNAHLWWLADAERGLGRPAAAAGVTRERRALWPADRAAQYVAAQEFALCIPRVDPASAGAAAERARYGDEAMDALRAALALGFRDGAWLARDPNLDPLRDRPDFRLVTAELLDRVFPAHPFAREHPSVLSTRH